MSQSTPAGRRTAHQRSLAQAEVDDALLDRTETAPDAWIPDQIDAAERRSARD